MSTTKINTGAILAGNERLPNALSSVEQARRTAKTVYDRLDRKVLGRNNLGSQLHSVEDRLEKVYSQIHQLHTTTEYSVNRYYTADQTIRSWIP